MTCVVGLVTQSGAYMGCDSISVDDENLYTISNTPKIKNIGGLLVGFAGSWKAGSQAFDQFERMQNPKIELFIKQFKTTETEWSLLVIEKGKLFEIQDDLSVIESRGDADGAYNAIGSGASVAFGSLYADHIDKASVLTALKASEAHCTLVRRPFSVLEVKM